MGLVIGNIYYIKNVATGKYLNVYGNDTVANERNVNVYTKEDVLAQKWIVRLAGDGARVYTAINEAYALNINTSSNNCSMYAAASNSLADSVVDFLTVDASQNLYRIKIMAHNKYLTVNSSDNAYFGTDAESFYSLWQLEDVNAATPEPTPDPVPSEIVNQTFFVKCYNTDYNLNVYGNNTVANNTNVTVYGKENVLAQKWVAKDTSAGPKLFTKINENFCLDIYTPNSNCDMYTASAGDDDTVIEFEPYNSTQKIYRIKMFNHDKYLCADTLSDGGNVSWSSSSSGNTLWQFVDEDTMFPDELTLNRRDFLEKLHDFLGAAFIPSAIIETKANTGYDSEEVEIFNNSLLEIKAKAGYRAGLTNTSSTEYFKNISIEYDRITDSAELVIGNEYVNISTDLDAFFNNSGKNTNDYLRDIAITLGDGIYSIKFSYNGDTTATVEIVKNIENLPEKPNLAINASVILTFSFTLKIDFPYRFKNELLSNLDPEFLFIIGFLGIVIFIYLATPIDEIIVAMLASGTAGTIFQALT